MVHSRSNVDFGRGFYVTPLYEQAAKWCGKFKRRGKEGIISKYEYDESRESELKVLKFDAYSEEWLDFILNCRSGKDMTDYDFVLGGVANDKVFNTVELFFDGLIDKTEAINRLRYEKAEPANIPHRESTILLRSLARETPDDSKSDFVRKI